MARTHLKIFSAFERARFWGWGGVVDWDVLFVSLIVGVLCTENIIISLNVRI